MLRGETVDDVLERVISQVKPPHGRCSVGVALMVATRRHRVAQRRRRRHAAAPRPRQCRVRRVASTSSRARTGLTAGRADPRRASPIGAWLLGYFVGGRPLYLLAYGALAVLGAVVGGRPPPAAARPDARSRPAAAGARGRDGRRSRSQLTAGRRLSNADPRGAGAADARRPRPAPGRRARGRRVGRPRVHAHRCWRRGAYTARPARRPVGRPVRAHRARAACSPSRSRCSCTRAVEPVEDHPLTRLWEDPPIRPPVSKPWPHGMEFYGMREYTPGDDVRRIVWRAFARTGELLVRESEQGITDKLMIVLDQDREQPLEGRRQRVVRGRRAARSASLGVHHLARGLRRHARGHERAARRARCAGRSAQIALLDALARAERGARARWRPRSTASLLTIPRDAHVVVITPLLDGDAAARLRLLVDRGTSVVVVALMWLDEAVDTPRVGRVARRPGRRDRPEHEPDPRLPPRSRGRRTVAVTHDVDETRRGGRGRRCHGRRGAGDARRRTSRSRRAAARVRPTDEDDGPPPARRSDPAGPGGGAGDGGGRAGRGRHLRLVGRAAHRAWSAPSLGAGVGARRAPLRRGRRPCRSVFPLVLLGRRRPSSLVTARREPRRVPGPGRRRDRGRPALPPAGAVRPGLAADPARPIALLGFACRVGRHRARPAEARGGHPAAAGRAHRDHPARRRRSSSPDLLAFLPILAALAVLFGGDSDRARRARAREFELKRAVRGGSSPPSRSSRCSSRSTARRSSSPSRCTTRPTSRRSRKAVPLSAADDRVLFEVATDAGLTGPWRTGVLDVYDDDDGFWKTAAASDLEALPGGRRPERRSAPVTTQSDGHDHRPRPRRQRRCSRASAARPRIAFASGPPGDARFDPRTQLVRVEAGRVPAGVVYTLSLPPYADRRAAREGAPVPSRRLRRAARDPRAARASSATSSTTAPDDAVGRLDLLRQKLLEQHHGVGRRARRSRSTPERVVEMFEDERRGDAVRDRRRRGDAGPLGRGPGAASASASTASTPRTSSSPSGPATRRSGSRCTSTASGGSR